MDRKHTKLINYSGFTLIELLIVVAIISILALIAVPNFLEAQTRAKVSRVKSDMRTETTALESYAADWNSYAVRRDLNNALPPVITKPQEMKVLTTPVAYISSLPVDIFNYTLIWPYNIFDYWDPAHTKDNYLQESCGGGWVLVSFGPDGSMGVFASGSPGGYPPDKNPLTFLFPYDPTNGTTSQGNIYRFQTFGFDGPPILKLKPPF